MTLALFSDINPALEEVARAQLHARRPRARVRAHTQAPRACGRAHKHRSKQPGTHTNRPRRARAAHYSDACGAQTQKSVQAACKPPATR